MFYLGALFAFALFFAEAGAVDLSYVAAVYEHSPVLNPEPRVPLSRLEALQHLQKNLDTFEDQAARAAQQGAHIIVFPEDGLQGFNFSRSSIAAYLESVPDPEQERWNPCLEPHRHNHTEVLQQLSCMARRYRLYLVANMADLQPCPLTTAPATCPPDGRWQFNTNVVFSSEGLLVARYHKHNLYFEAAFDVPPRPEIVTFDTPFAGKFGLITCFDILFREPAVTLVEKGVRQMVFPSAWMNQLPFLTSIQFQRAFSLGANVTLLAANIRNDQLIMTGSGIYTPFSATYHHARRGDPQEGRLLVARVPVLDPEWLGERTGPEQPPAPVESPGFCSSQTCFLSGPSPPPASPVFISSMMYDPFTFALLGPAGGEAGVCNGTFCCHLRYRWLRESSRAEVYALGAFAGTHTVNGRYAVQVCALVRCAGSDASSCGLEVEEAESQLDFVLEGTFGSRFVYPSVLASGMVLEQPELVQTSADGRVRLKHSSRTGGLVTACLYGRMYHLDAAQSEVAF